jgi:IclR family transcriptional regulator, KDG regulon repressor
VERACAVLGCLADEDRRLVEIVEQVGLHKATVARLLAALTSAGMVVRDDRERYTLGPGVVRLTGRLLGRYRSLADLLRDSLERLSGATGETVTVHVRVGAERLCIEELESRHEIAFRSGIGARVPIHSGSAGKVLLAFLPEVERHALLQQLTFKPITERTITRRDRLAEELEKVRRRGYAISVGERILGATGVSVPVLDRDGRPQAAISILGPDFRMPPEALDRYAALLKREVRPLPVVISDGSLSPALSGDRAARRGSGA